jgi:hypothetical protein
MPFQDSSAKIDARTAVGAAMRNAAEILGQTKTTLEEIERETYKGRDAWAITLGVPREAWNEPAGALRRRHCESAPH